MLKDCDTGNVDSRRAYALDSRTTWVESAHHGGGHVVGKDNRVLGPGEYTPAMPTSSRKHISGPALGGSRGLADHFHPFKSLLGITRPSQSSNNKIHKRGGGMLKRYVISLYCWCLV